MKHAGSWPFARARGPAGPVWRHALWQVLLGHQLLLGLWALGQAWHEPSSEALGRLALVGWLGALTMAAVATRAVLRQARAAPSDAQATVRSAREQRMQAVLETVPEALFGLDAQARIVTANAALVRVFGRMPEDVIGQTIDLLMPGLSAAALREALEGGILMAGGRSRLLRMEASAQRQDGTAFPVHLAITELPAGEALSYTLLAHDATEERAAQDRLHLYSDALEATRNGIVIAQVGPEGERIVYTNPAFTAITGYAPWEMLGGKCSRLQGPDTAQPEVQQLRAAIAAAEPVALTLRNRRRDGSLFFNKLSIAPIGKFHDGHQHFIGVIADVTQAVEAEREIAERGARLDALFALSPDGFLLFDATGRLVHGNPAAGQILDLKAGLAAALPRRSALEEELRRRRDPTERGPVLDPRGVLLTLVQPVRKVLEISERSSTEGGESIVHIRDVTRETEVDRMKSEFLTTAAHELRTPMSSIFGYAELLLRRKHPPERQLEMLRTIHHQTALVVQMVNELLDLARIEARQGKDFVIGPHAAADIVAEAIEGFGLPQGREPVQCRPPEAGLRLMVDADKSRQALVNVLSNAYKYSAPGQAVTLDCVGPRSGPGPVARLGLRVRDAGIGMSPATQARLFERFFRADPSGNIPGTGLGMALVKEVVELQGGAVEVDSALGAGTTVVLWLPLAPD